MNPSRDTGLYLRYEKAGLILDALPIPRSADAIILEANVRLPAKSPRDKSHFTLQWNPGDARFPAELVSSDKRQRFLRVFFRLNVPEQSGHAVVRWGEHVLGEIDVPVISLSEVIDSFALEMPTLYATLSGRSVACRAYVSGQAKSLLASALVRSAGPIGPAVDLAFNVIVQDGTLREIGSVALPISTDNMRQRQMLTTALLPRLPRMGDYNVSWHLGQRCLGSRQLRVISRHNFANSLRVSATRFLLETSEHEEVLVRALPSLDGALNLEGIRRVMPVFYVSSNEPGVAGLAPFTIRALVGDVVTTLAIQENVLVTDGLCAVHFDFLPAGEISSIRHFSLASGDRILGNLPIDAGQAASFTAEGGFAPLDDILWSPAAEEQLNDRLGKLLEGE